MENNSLRLYAVCPPGLELALSAELLGLGIITKPETGSGGVDFSGSLEDIYRANLHLRTASRVLLRMGSFQVSKFVELVRKTGNLSWETYLHKDRPLAYRITTHHSRLYHSKAVEERVHQGIANRLGYQPSVAKYNEESNQTQLVVIRILDDECTISMDTSGAPLHHRGYRQALAKAPLRETLAAGMLISSGWDRESPLIDPFCGSGVIPIEAALLAANIPPGHQRSFSFMEWPGYDPSNWRRLLKEADRKKIVPPAVILGSDRDEGAISMARENIERAGVSELVQFTQRAVSAIEPPAQRGWIVTNPPYGVRVSQNQDLRNLYAQFGKVLKSRCPGWQVAFLCTDDRLATLTGLTFIKGLSLVNGGIPVKLNLGHVPE